jgi:hypothetical protein
VLPVPTPDELATFSGRPASSYGLFAAQALEQATLMFSIVTGLSDYPDDPDLAKLARYAILELADRLFLEQPFAEYIARPFQTETIMSYSYSRSTQTATKVQQGIKTGLFWWDLAIDKLALPGTSLHAHGSIHPVPDGLARTSDTTWDFINPADEDGPGKQPYIRIS